MYLSVGFIIHGFICCKALYIRGKLSTIILFLSVHIGRQFHLFYDFTIYLFTYFFVKK